MASSTKRPWFHLEANPDIMNQFVWGLGVPEDGVEFNDIYGLDHELLEMVSKPVLTMLFLYPDFDQLPCTDWSGISRPTNGGDGFATEGCDQER